MKKTAFAIFMIVFFFIRCEEVVQIEVHSGTPKLIIDASFQMFFDETPVTSNTVVKLSLSADYFENEIPAVTNATVFVTNLINNTVIPFLDEDLDGNYIPENTFIAEDATPYELTIIYNNETYKGTATKIKSIPLTSVVQGERTLFSGEETEVIVTFSDDATQENYYLFDFSNNIYNVLEDRFFNGSDYNFSAFYQEDEIELPADVLVKMSGISKEYYTYFRVLLNQSGQGGGGPFETQPAALLGNIVNTTDTNNFPLGYFHISETDTTPLRLVKMD